ncbi:PKD domain-containing protein, partial [Xanthomonas citri pv. citri]
YPGFTSDFKLTGSCYQSPFLFTDASYAKYGTINSWLWDFGDSYSGANSAAIANPSHLFKSTGSYTVNLVTGSSKGCVDTSSTTVLVSDKPFLALPFKDTLICSIDTLDLQAIGNGNFSWAPAGNIINPNSARPSV